MLIFKDALNGDELFSDSFPIKEIDGIVYEIETKVGTKTETGNYNIGSNPSADGAGEDDAVEAVTQTVNNLVDSCRLMQTVFDKKSYMVYIKGYMKKLLDYIKEHNPSRTEAFQKGAQEFVKKILSKFDEYTFYTGESMDPEAMVALMFYKEDGITPYFYFFKDGVIEEKV